MAVEAIGRVDFPMADVYPIIDNEEEVVEVVERGSRPSEVEGREGTSLAVADKVRRCDCCAMGKVMGCIKLEHVGRGIREVRTLKSMLMNAGCFRLRVLLWVGEQEDVVELLFDAM